MKMVRLMLLATCVVLWATAAYAQKSSLTTDTQHGGISTNKCDGCHTPHSGSNAEAYLWKLSVGSSLYTTYTSPTMDNATSNITGPGDGNLTPGAPINNTLLCLSCHDGALAAAQTPPILTTTATHAAAAGVAITGTDLDIGGTTTLENDHPVNMSHNPTADPGLQPVLSVDDGIGGGPLRLYGASNTVQCGSCHDPHKQATGGPGVGNYLRVSSAAGALCLTCHI